MDDIQQQVCDQEVAECEQEEGRWMHITNLDGLLKDAIAIEHFVQFEVRKGTGRERRGKRGEE
jgi:hypothetical protein